MSMRNAKKNLSSFVVWYLDWTSFDWELTSCCYSVKGYSTRMNAKKRCLRRNCLTKNCLTKTDSL